MKPIITFSLGGSIINPGTIDRDFLVKFSNLIKSKLLKYRFMIVCGGGITARNYIKALPEGLSEGERDYMGIAATWLNAQLLTYYFKDNSSPVLPTTIEDLRTQMMTYDIGLSGGFLPAVKTDEDAAILADLFASPILINVTNVDGVYDKDPSKFDNAEFFPKLTYREFYEIISPVSIGAGSNAPFTLIAAKICERSNIKIVICPKDLEKLSDAMDGLDVGTVIKNQ